MSRWSPALLTLALLGCFDEGGGSSAAGIAPDDAGPGDLRFAVEPAELGFGQLDVGQRARASLRVTNTGRRPLPIRLSMQFPGAFGVTFAGGDPLAQPELLADPDADGRPGLGLEQSFLIDVTFDARAPGRYFSALVLEAGAHSVTVPLVGEAASPRCLDLPATVDFGALPALQEGQRPLVLAPCTDRPILINGLRLTDESDPGFWLAGPRPPFSVPPEQAIEVHWRSRAPGAYAGTILVETDDPDAPARTVALSGRATENACPVAAPGPAVRAARQGEIVPLDGSASTDPDGRGGVPQAWLWLLTHQPSDAEATLFEPGTGGEDDPGTPVAAFIADVPGQYTARLEVTDERGQLGGLCGQAVALVQIAVERWPPPELQVVMDWFTPGLPDLRRSLGTAVDLHLRHPQAADWFDARLDCRPRSCEQDWGRPGEEGDPWLNSPMSGPNRAVFELDGVQDTGALGAPYRVAFHYTRDADPADGYDFGPSGAALQVLMWGEPIWSSAPIGLDEAGDFYEAIEIHWPSGRIVEVGRRSRRPVP